MKSLVEDFSHLNKALAVQIYYRYIDALQSRLYSRLADRLPKEGIEVEPRYYNGLSWVAMEFPECNNLSATINFHRDKPWEFKAHLHLLNNNEIIDLEFESKEFSPIIEVEYLDDPDKQAARIESQFVDYIKEIYFVAKRVTLKGENE